MLLFLFTPHTTHIFTLRFERLTLVAIMVSEAFSTALAKDRSTPMSPMLRMWRVAVCHKWYPGKDSKTCLRIMSRDVDPETRGVDANCFIYGQKLQRHRLSGMEMQDEHVFPKCVGRSRCPHFDEKLWPQYGDLKGHIFSQGKPLVQCNILEVRRAELVRKVSKEGIVIECPAKREGKVDPGPSREHRTGATLDNELAEKMREQLRITEEKRKAERHARRLMGKDPTEPVNPEVSEEKEEEEERHLGWGLDKLL
jgi:hypothetical protein